ncbi:sulfite exporter TauE/SafE family protein [Achromobacter denitrificans]
MSELLYPACVVLLGYAVLGITGFGSALVIVPLLAWRWPLPEVVAFTLLMDVPASLLHGGLNLRLVNFSELLRLLPGMVAGALAGLWLSSALDARWPLMLLGCYVAIIGIRSLMPQPAGRPALPPGRTHTAGAAIGMVEMLFGAAGPLIAAWLNRRLSDIHVLRASTPIVIAVSACSVLLAMGAAGRLSSPEIWQRWLWLLGAATIGVILGNILARRIAPGALRRLICGLLVVSGGTLVMHALQAG